MSPNRWRTLLSGTGLTALVTTSAIALGGGSAAAVAGDRSAVDRADALVTASIGDAFSTGRTYAPGAEARGRAAARAGAVPLPPGQEFDDIDWDNGALTDADIEGLLEFNAACRWWIADADAPTKDSARVVATIPGWPTMRGGERHAAAVAFVSADGRDFAAQVLAYCRAASAR